MPQNKNLDVLRLIISKIHQYLKKNYAIPDLIYDLERYLKELKTIDNHWEADFQESWMTIEIIYALSLDQERNALTPVEQESINESLKILQTIATDKLAQLINEGKLYNCRVCGLNQGFEPWENNGERPTHAICPCCGADFGYDDETPLTAKKYRAEWIANGAQWFCPDEKRDPWSLEEQLKNIPKDFR